MNIYDVFKDYLDVRMATDEELLKSIMYARKQSFLMLFWATLFSALAFFTTGMGYKAFLLLFIFTAILSIYFKQIEESRAARLEIRGVTRKLVIALSISTFYLDNICGDEEFDLGDEEPRGKCILEKGHEGRHKRLDKSGSYVEWKYIP